MISGPLASLPTAAAVEVGGSAGAAHMDLGAPAAAEGAAPNQTTTPATYAEALHQIGQLVDQGVPAPLTIMTLGADVIVSIHHADLPAWVGALDIPAPEWSPTPYGEGLVLNVARWPAEVRNSLLFHLVSTDLLVAEPTCSEACPLSCSIGLSGCTGECR